ncbi:MAG TPA: hypothetical protein VFF73_30875 [Planctomycetota bacterium]|nr:hypothetical protein [Planctomycetota bacterium]
MKTLLIASCVVLLAAGTSAAEESVESCRKLTAIFDRLDLPHVAGKKFASFNTGQYRLGDGKVVFGYEPGWVIEDNEKEVTLFQENLEVVSYRKDAPLPPGWDSLKKDHPNGWPLPCELMEFDFEEFCGDILKEGIPNEKDDPGEHMARIDHRAWGGFSHVVELVLKAKWCLEREHPDTAVKLVTLARKSFDSNLAARSRGERDREKTLERELEVSVAENARWRAIRAADRHAPRAKLLASWKLVSDGLPESPWTAEATALVRLYEREIAEDAAIAEVASSELAKRPDEEQAAYWVRELRDLDTRQWCERRIYWPRVDQKNPAAHLIQLGWSAVPALIAHLEDESPTRAMEYYREHALNTYSLYRVADTCHALLYEVTGQHFPEHAQLYGPERRSRVARDWKNWWDATGPKGAEKHFVGLLANEWNDFRWGVAAKSLLRLDAARFAPGICKNTDGTLGPDDRRRLVEQVGFHADADDEALFAKFLDDESVSVVIATAWVLRSRCGSERGAERVLALASSWKVEGNVPAGVDGHDLVTFLMAGRPVTQRLVDGLVGLMDSALPDMKAAALAEAWRLPDERLARALLQRLDRKSVVGTWGREGDLAASGLKHMLRVPGSVDFHDGPEQPREDMKAELRKALAHERGIDWAVLERQTNEEVWKVR